MKALSFPKNIRIPSGKTATLSEMKDYGAMIQRFIKETEAGLQSEKNTRQYNDAVDYLNHIASHYNHELQVFNRAEQKRRATLLCKYMQSASM